MYTSGVGFFVPDYIECSSNQEKAETIQDRKI